MKTERKNGKSDTSCLILSSRTFQAFFEEKLVEYIDSEDNPVYRLTEEIGKTIQQIEKKAEEAKETDELCEKISKQQENFFRKLSELPKTYRNVGVNVNIMPSDDRNMNWCNEPNICNLNAPGSLTASSNPTYQQVKAKAGVAHVPVPLPTRNKQAVLSVDLVDLTNEDDKILPEQFKLSSQLQVASMKDAVVNRPFPMQRGDGINVSPRFAAAPQSPRLPSLQANVASSGNSVVNSHFIGAPKGVPSGSAESQQLYFAPGNLMPYQTGTEDNRAGSLSRKTASVSVPSTGSALLNTDRSISAPKSAVLMSSKTNHILAGQNSIETLSSSPMRSINKIMHPAPLPEQPKYPLQNKATLSDVPPKPTLKVTKPADYVVLSWSMPITGAHAQIKTYQLYGYKETSSRPDSSMWKKVGEVKALPLPMACTLTQFAEQLHYFAIRAVDVHNREGPFSDIGDI